MRRHLYPPNWEEIVAQVRARSGDCCEWCGAANREPHPVTGSRVMLTTAHLNHDPADSRLEVLRHLCQRCHLRYDARHHADNARRTRARKLAEGQRTLIDA